MLKLFIMSSYTKKTVLFKVLNTLKIMGNGYEIAKNTPTFKKIEVPSLKFSEYPCTEKRSILSN